MAEIGIDQSKLPGVKEVCRDFAVLEDHTLAHSLQEQEIEHHLATNVQRNRLVQYDLQVAKQLQEEEDRKARAHLQGQHREEQQDCEIAQEIQVKLAIEAERQRQQEEADEDIARILQQKELQEEKGKKKPPSGPLRQSPSREGHYPESRERLCSSPELPRCSRPQTGAGRSPQTREAWRGPPLLSEDLDLEVGGSSSEVRKARGKQQGSSKKRSRKAPSDTEEKEPAPKGHGGATWGPHPLVLDAEAPPAGKRDRDLREKRLKSLERHQETPPPVLDWEEEGEGGRFRNGHCKRRERRLPDPERSPRPPVLNADSRGRPSVRQYGRSSPPNPEPSRLSSWEDQCSPRSPSHYAGHQGLEAVPRHTLQKDGERGPQGTRASPLPLRGEHRDLEAGHHRKQGPKSRGTKGDASARPRVAAAHGQELDDAEIARRLQEEELLANQLDRRAAQVAQDEEIARLLMAEEKKAYRKAKERETRRQDEAWKQDTPEAVCSRSREGYESHRGRSEKPTRVAVPLTEDLDHLPSFTGQHNLAHQIAKPEPAHKGYHHKP